VLNYQEGLRIKLAFDADNGLTLLRDPDENGFIPVSSPAELRAINTVAGALAWKFKQDKDIDLINKEWTPIGTTAAAAFRGEFDGGGYEIRGLRISGTTNYRGFFGSINGAKLRNIRLTSGTVNGGQYVAALCAQASGQGNSIINCRTAVDVTSTSNQVAGICATVNTGTTLEITACENSGTVTSSGQYVAGICAYVNGNNANRSTVTITACRNTGKVAGGNNSGGICAQNAATYGVVIIRACYNTGEVNIGGSNRVGGIMGYIAAGSNSITACYSIGSITGSGNYVGFICGRNVGNASAITTSYWAKNGGNAARGIGDGPGTTTVFSASAWPTATGAWGTGDGSAENTWWKNLGGWNSGTPIYPKLYWEE
jgi:hypothetical protein